jgi:tetratricopeptide (TPR) repeat protein
LSVELASCFQNAVLAREHSIKVSKIAQEHRSPYSRVFALWCNGLAEVTRGDLESAHESYSQALDLVMGTRVAVEFETEIQASLAERHYKAGKLDEAMAIAKEAVALSQKRSNRLTECRALIVWGGVLRQAADAGSLESAVGLFNQAEQLIKQTGARMYEQSLVSERGQLAQIMGR